MKRCPTCNKTFAEDWLAFCTDDGTTLVDDSSSRSEPPPTMMAPMPPSVAPSEQPTFDLPGSSSSKPSPHNPPASYTPSSPIQSGWQPPPPPAYANKPKQGLAVASFVLGLCSVTIGFCCYIGTITSAAAIVLGIVSLSQIKSDPEHNTGKPFSIIGIVCGGLYYLIIAFIILIYGAAILMGGLNR